MKYLLPCTCGQSIPIEVGQAGQRVTCVCGATLEVPTMRGIRELVPVEEKADAKQASRGDGTAWSPLQGSLFALGMLLLMIGLVLGAYCGYVVSQIDTSKPQELTDWENNFDKEFDKVGADQLYELHKQLMEQGIGPRTPPNYVLMQRISKFYVKCAIAAGIGACVGLVLIVGSLVIGSKQSAA